MRFLTQFTFKLKQLICQIKTNKSKKDDHKSGPPRWLLIIHYSLSIAQAARSLWPLVLVFFRTLWPLVLIFWGAIEVLLNNFGSLIS